MPSPPQPNSNDDLTGRVFNQLTVIEYIGPTSRGDKDRYRCLCECGAAKVVRGLALTTGTARSAGPGHRRPRNSK